MRRPNQNLEQGMAKGLESQQLCGLALEEATCAPVIRWAGSKRKLVPQLAAAVPRVFGTYFEPFFGSGCLFFHLKPKKAVVSDLNENLIDFYTTLREHPSRVVNSATRFRRTPEGYYKARASFASETDPVRRAALFLYLNRMCFNGLYRTNSVGIFNVPFGTKTGSFPRRTDVLRSVAQLDHASILCADFQTVLREAKSGDFVYLDPPYVYKSRRDRGEYGPSSFSICDIPRLSVLVHQLDDKGVRFLLSYLDCPDVQTLAERFRVKKAPVARCISGLASARRVVNELLISNY